MKYWLWCWLLLACAVRADVGDNLIPNPDFAKGLQHWKASFPEANETKYAGNEKLVAVINDPTGGTGKVLQFVVPPAVGQDQGVKCSSQLVKVNPHGCYEFGADIYTTNGCTVYIFMEGYQEDPSRTDPLKDQGDNQYLGYVRVYRADIQGKVSDQKWSTISRVAVFDKAAAAAKRGYGSSDEQLKSDPTTANVKPLETNLSSHQPTWVLLKLYVIDAAGAANAKTYFRNVFLHAVPPPPDTKAKPAASKPGNKADPPAGTVNIPTIAPPAGQPTAGAPPTAGR